MGSIGSIDRRPRAGEGNRSNACFDSDILAGLLE